MRRLVFLIFFTLTLFVVTSCGVGKSFSKSPQEYYKIVGIDDYETFYVIYANSMGKTYRVVSEKEPFRKPTESYLQEGKRYKLRLLYMYPAYFSCLPVVAAIDGKFVDAGAQDGIEFGIYASPQLSGLYFRDSILNDSCVTINFTEIIID
ncbi:MAG: hypothetical protein IJM58_06550 [Muribaculaceae bacterium]|nr:hypothetical protein [Muribaculaceae bacterium]